MDGTVESGVDNKHMESPTLKTSIITTIKPGTMEAGVVKDLLVAATLEVMVIKVTDVNSPIT